jgi:hypothetical protein
VKMYKKTKKKQKANASMKVSPLEVLDGLGDVVLDILEPLVAQLLQDISIGLETVERLDGLLVPAAARVRHHSHLLHQPSPNNANVIGSVADPDSGSDAFWTPGSGIRDG